MSIKLEHVVLPSAEQMEFIIEGTRNPNTVINYKDEMVAYTERVGYCSFATERQLMESDLYIINPSGYYDLALAVSRRELDVELIPVFITDIYRM